MPGDMGTQEKGTELQVLQEPTLQIMIPAGYIIVPPYLLGTHSRPLVDARTSNTTRPYTDHSFLHIQAVIKCDL